MIIGLKVLVSAKVVTLITSGQKKNLNNGEKLKDRNGSFSFQQQNEM